jgi:dUTP pyrophosphatase
MIMKKLKVKIKRLHPNSVMPSYAHSTDCGLDLTAVSKTYDEYGNIVYGFGLAFEIPEGYAGFIFPRSSNCRTGLWLTNHVGVIDANFRGEVTAKFSRGKDVVNEYNIGDRVAQMVILPYPKVEFNEVEELSETERGKNGYGSTGK